MSQIGLIPFYRAVDTNGNPLPNARLYTFLTGTLTPQATYTTDALSVSHGPYVEADANGLFPAFFPDPTLIYRYQLRVSPYSEAVTGCDADPVTSLSSGSITFLAPGTGAVTRTVSDYLSDTVNVLNYMTAAQKADVRAGTALVDVTAAIQAAITYASANDKKSVYFPAGVYRVGSTITIAEVVLHGDGERASKIRPVITDGSPVIDVTSGTTFFGLHDIGIDNDLWQPSWLSGAIDAQNCIGIRMASSGSFSAHYHLRNVMIRGCKVGWKPTAYIASVHKLTIYNCETGIIGDQLNGCEIGVKFENCRIDKVITNSAAVTWVSYTTEGDVLQYGTATSTVDDCQSFVYLAPYFERVQNVPFITFGATTECTAIELHGIRMARASNAGMDLDTYSLAFDKVDGLSISGFYADYLSLYSSTANTKNIIDRTVPDGNFWPHDASKNLSPARNHFPNSNFDHWFGGWETVNKQAGSLSRETTIVRRGANAIKVTMTAAAVDQTQLVFVPWDSAVLTQIRGKKITCYWWIWIPNDAAFNPNTSPLPTLVKISATPNGTGGAEVQSADNSYKRNAWNLFKVTNTIPSDATSFFIALRMDKSSGTPAGTEYVVVDSIYIVEGDGQDAYVLNGYVSDSDVNPCNVVGGLLQLTTDTVPADTDQTYQVGDVMKKRTITAGGTEGLGCTTAGVGGTAVFKALGSVAA